MSKGMDAARVGHTPGPWSIDGTRIVASDSVCVVDCVGAMGGDDSQADKRLLAAAPELLAALQSASRALTELDPLADHHDARPIDEALSKALGHE